jgi:DNA mismatch endonuclease, patch repair protein
VTPAPVDERTRARMERQRRYDTAPELALRRELHRRGLRYRIDRSPISGLRARADLVFGPAKVAVFVDGCYWHSCPEHGSLPTNNREWWRAKFAANRGRDRRVDRALREAGWVPMRIWEHEAIVEAADRIESLVRERRSVS